TASSVTSGYCSACACALLAIAAIQPWSAAGAENPMVTGRPGSLLAPAGAGATAGASLPPAGSLLVHAVSAAPAPTPSAPVRNLRRCRPRVGSDMVISPSMDQPVAAERCARAWISTAAT